MSLYNQFEKCIDQKFEQCVHKTLDGIVYVWDYGVKQLTGHEIVPIENYIPNMVESAVLKYAQPIYEDIFNCYAQTFKAGGFDIDPRMPDLIISEKVKRAHVAPLPLLAELDEEGKVENVRTMVYVAEGVEMAHKAMLAKQTNKGKAKIYNEEVPLNIETVMKHMFAHELFHYFSLSGDIEMDELAAELNAQRLIFDNCPTGETYTSILWASQMVDANMMGYEIKDVREVRCAHQFSDESYNLMQRLVDHYHENSETINKKNREFMAEKEKHPPIFLTPRFIKENPKQAYSLQSQKRFIRSKLNTKQKINKELKYPAGYIRYFKGEDPKIELNSWIKNTNNFL